MKKLLMLLLLIVVLIGSNITSYYFGNHIINYGYTVKPDGSISKLPSIDSYNTKTWLYNEIESVNLLLIVLENIKNADSTLYDSVFLQTELFDTIQARIDDVDLTFTNN